MVYHIYVTTSYICPLSATSSRHTTHVSRLDTMTYELEQI